MVRFGVYIRDVGGVEMWSGVMKAVNIAIKSKRRELVK